LVIDHIDRFEHRWAFLSNFHPSPIWVDDRLWPSVEHAYQAAKTDNPNWQERIRNEPSPKEAKWYGKRFPPREDWEEIKLQVMADLVGVKFAPGTAMANDLLRTQEARLTEGNWWHDNYWGVCLGCSRHVGPADGQNWLGRLLMRQRDVLRRTLIATGQLIMGSPDAS
jgi:ribA/ribD-fused uncharacterized protein